ncbi:MAG: guanylate kinase [Phycisphaerae bacterium]|nr:guanylate kinase [Phycisphaerae bacterium]
MAARSEGMLIVVSGPSGVGKSTICARLVERLDGVLSVSATTRPMGKGEVDGRNYYFLTREEFEAKLAEGEFLEHAEYLGNLYGTPATPVREAIERGKDVLLEIEVLGGTQVARRHPEAVTIYLLPPDSQALTGRIQGRGRDAQAVIDERLANARKEIELARESGVYRHFVVNDDLAETVSKIVEVIEQERQATSRN